MHGSGIFADHARCAGLMLAVGGGINTSNPCTVSPTAFLRVRRAGGLFRERGCLMIDTAVFLSLKTKTEMHIVALLSSIQRPLQQCEIVNAIKSTCRTADRHNCSKTLKRLAEQGVIREFKEFGSPLYSVAQIPSPVSSPSHNVNLSKHESNELKRPSEQFSNASTPQAKVAADSGEHSISLTTQAAVSTTPDDPTLTGLDTVLPSGSATSGQIQSEPTPGTLLDGEAGSAVEQVYPHDSSAPAEPGRSAGGAANTTAETDTLPETNPGLYGLVSDPEKTKQALKRNQKKIADERQQYLFRIIHTGATDGSLFWMEDPTGSLYQMIENMEGKTAADPDFEQEYDANGLPTKTCPMIPMYDAFVAYIRILWAEVRPHLTVTRTVYDFVVQRAAYLFATAADNFRHAGVGRRKHVRHCHYASDGGRNGNHRHNRPCRCKSHRRATLFRCRLVGNVMGRSREKYRLRSRYLLYGKSGNGTGIRLADGSELEHGRTVSIAGKLVQHCAKVLS